MFERSRQGAVSVVTGGGLPLNEETSEQLASCLQQCLREGQPRAVFDMQTVPLIDSAGLEQLLDVQESFGQRGGMLKLAAPNALCRDILSVTGVENQFEIYPEVKVAVGSFLQ